MLSMDHGVNTNNHPLCCFASAISHNSTCFAVNYCWECEEKMFYKSRVQYTNSIVTTSLTALKLLVHLRLRGPSQQPEYRERSADQHPSVSNKHLLASQPLAPRHS